MIDGWRLCRRPFADLTGEGARRFGGRWNPAGWPVVYFADHPALAVLEVRVHLDLPHELLPDDYVLMRARLPTKPTVIAEVPEQPAMAGQDWLRERRTPLLRVPSVLVPYAGNFLLNPEHPGARKASIVSTEPFRFDTRLWEPAMQRPVIRNRLPGAGPA